MKKLTSFLIFYSATALTAFAGAELTPKTEPGDPKKDKETHQNFGLTKGYFSLFSLFCVEEEKADTLKTIMPFRDKKMETTPKSIH